LSLLNSLIWVHSTQIPLHETQHSTQLDLSLLKIWAANFSTQIATQVRKMADELGLLLSLSNNSRRKREFKPRTHPLDEYDDVEFKKRFRLSKTTVEKLLEEVI